MNPGVNEFFCRYHYGTLLAADPENMKKWGIAVRKIVSADGFSDKEKQFWKGIGEHIGSNEEMIKAVWAADIDNIKMAELLKGFSDTAARRAMLYDAICIASVDGYSEKERALAAQAAEILGVDKGTLHSIEAMVEADNALRRARGALISGT
jgi:hypothetical protein